MKPSRKLDLKKNNKVFIIGATGYIGSAFSEKLLSLGCDVTGSTRADVEKTSTSSVMKFVRGSFEDLDNLIAAAKSADVLIYTAYAYNPPNGKQRADKELKDKQSHITKILEAIKGLGKVFVLISGCGVIGDSKDVVYQETTEFLATEDSVINARRALEEEVLNYDGRGIVLRPPVVYGRKGSFMIPKFLIEYAVNNKESIYIENSQNNKWSTVHIDDLTDLLISAIEYAPASSLYNTASESGITTLQIAESISRAVGLNGKTRAISLESARHLIYADGKTFGHWANWWEINSQCSGEKAKETFNWKPNRPSMLEDIEHGSYKECLKEEPLLFTGKSKKDYVDISDKTLENVKKKAKTSPSIPYPA